MKKSYIITAAIIAFVLCMIIAGLTILNSYLGTPGNKISNEDFEESVKITEKGYELIEEAKNIKVRERKTVLQDIHEMANTKIVAEDGKILGRKEINEESLNGLIIEVTKSDFSDKQRLLDILGTWKKKDYSKSVEAHNYVWNQLGGTIGKAVEVISE
jgi:hypothetical protein